MKTKQFGLETTVLASFQDIFEKFENIEKVIVYGSRAKGNFRYNSDIDLSIIGEVSYDDLLKIEFLIDELLLPYKVDLSVFNKIDNSDLKTHIERVGIVLYKKNNK
ncbi:nucleotidyltransferase domain-containing protein [Capnocytophaga canimorsus]|uniref:nucleotidyltransferase domain-containing protein n=1 Tax=Capnocytophaga canimorsus TaxID=28188 RepID=UPI00385854A8